MWLLQQIREHPAARVPVIAVTGRARRQDHGIIRSAGFDAYLVKPIDLDELVDLIANLTG
jgi:DNA-binding response OmpR family regulator